MLNTNHKTSAYIRATSYKVTAFLVSASRICGSLNGKKRIKLIFLRYCLHVYQLPWITRCRPGPLSLCQMSLFKVEI